MFGDVLGMGNVNIDSWDVVGTRVLLFLSFTRRVSSLSSIVLSKIS